MTLRMATEYVITFNEHYTLSINPADYLTTEFRMNYIDEYSDRTMTSTLNGNKAASTHVADVPKGDFAVYVRNEKKMKRFLIPISYLNRPSFQELLSQV
ncbi:Small auxin-up RNA [Parasponia andersonii]|uniref:Small auxin-up RNA n=1 Tax=Parasponia andersonii TaxID=3476 RepID=A0A2P5AT72_PARAD|nr:Small auxin-up RNA [Parasponia andersonii]